ncbi:MAG: SbcC/MukB-like Walker B domain-containing protein, partial [Cyanobacteria bacterium P01_A01_bin.135]
VLRREHQQLTQELQGRAYGQELVEELQAIDHKLQQIRYDERSHAIARGEVDRWRWADVKQAELQQAQKQRRRLGEQRQALAAQMEELTAEIEALADSKLQQAIDQLDQQLTAIAYDGDRHLAVRQQLNQAQGWVARHHALQQAQQQMPSLSARQQSLAADLQARTATLQATQGEAAQLEAAIQEITAAPEALATLEEEHRQLAQVRDQQFAQLGRLEQQQQQLANQQQRYNEAIAEQQQLKHQGWLYEELTHAFGRNGIQALIIETVLPQLEADANRILGRLSANQLHLQFVTQRASKTKVRGQAKLIDTLDILIADTQGTRPYETYSGGEAFRVNFAIRLAIARLLAQRSGTPLQLLVIDEGFGTQDAAGCDRLISAINAIAADFACVLTVTHIPYLKEAFQARIEVVKTEEGSQLQLVT